VGRSGFSGWSRARPEDRARCSGSITDGGTPRLRVNLDCCRVADHRLTRLQVQVVSPFIQKTSIELMNPDDLFQRGRIVSLDMRLTS
jgi:hypothetical protein